MVKAAIEQSIGVERREAVFPLFNPPVEVYGTTI
jgi:hypothetical protein